MRAPERLIVRGKGGWHGTLETSLLLGGSEPRVLVRLDDGKQVLVPTEVLALQEDGSYFASLSPAELEQPDTVVKYGRIGKGALPSSGRVLIYQVEGQEAGNRRVRVRASAGEASRRVEESALENAIEFSAMPARRLMDGPANVLCQADTIVVPGVNRALTAEQRLVLRHELQTKDRRHSVTKTVVALYDDIRAAEGAVRDLVDSAFRRDDISLVLRDPDGGQSASRKAGAHASSVLDGVAELLTGADTLAIPGVGAIIAAGPFIGTLAGAGMGAVEGGLPGALVDAGVPEDEAQLLAEGVRRGATLVMVRASDQLAGRARDIMTENGAVDFQSRSGEWRREGWQETELEREPEDETDQPPSYATSPMQIDEQIGPERADSVYGGTEYRNAERAGTEYVEDQDLAAHTQEPAGQGGDPSMSATREAGLGFSSGAEQTGAGYQGGAAEGGPRPGLVRARDFDSLGGDFHRHYDTVYAGRGDEYERYKPAYRFGFDLVQDQRFQNRRWSEIEPEAQRLWEGMHPSNGWDRIREAVRFGWERGIASGAGQQSGGFGTGKETGTGAAGSAGDAARRNRTSHQGPEERRI